jgi:hypothetical protein
VRPAWIAAIVVVVLAAGIAGYSAGVGSTGSSSGISTYTAQSSPLGSSSSVFSGSGSSIAQSTAQQSSPSQYPLVWAPNSPSGCYYDEFNFCVEAVLGFSDNASIAFTATSSTTIIEGNATTIIHSDTAITTTIIRTGTQTVSCQAPGNATSAANNASSVSSTSCTSSIATYPETDVTYVPYSAHAIQISALVQNATTGQDIIMGGGGSFVSGSCNLAPTGYTRCYAAGHLSYVGPGPLSYKVTLFITKAPELPCQLMEHDSSCSVPLLAPIQTTTVTE